MTRKHILPIVAAIALIVGTLAFRLWPRTLKPEECSVLYQRYADSPDICLLHRNHKKLLFCSCRHVLIYLPLQLFLLIIRKAFPVCPIIHFKA